MWPEQVKKHKGQRGALGGNNKVTHLIATPKGRERTIFFICFMGVCVEDDIKREGK